jgi:EAL domain-containing protein (putative c-di-GMP-specific phosphodiesterase class I)
VAPLDFIPAAEASGQIVPIGRFVLRQACRQAVAWQARFPAWPLRMSVNVSARQLQEPDVAEDIKRVVDECGMDPRLLVLEITETVLVKDVEAMAAKLRALTACGLRVAVDDFGTGYSSLSYLHRLPLDALKIDRSFVSQMVRGDRHAQLVNTILQLARSVNLRVVAEGVSTPDQLELLREFGCEYAQGFLFSHALPPEQVRTYIEERRAVPR